MYEKIYVPELDLHSPTGKRVKSSRSMNHYEEIGYFSPNHHLLTMTSRHGSPIQHCQQHQIKSQSKNSEYYTKRKCKHCCKSKSKCKDCCKTTSRTPANANKYSNRNYPMDYLDYQPETLPYKSFLPFFDYRLPQIPTLDNYQEPKYEQQYGQNKQYDMYTQTQMQNAYITQQNKHKNARKSFELNPILLINQQNSDNQHKRNEHILQAEKIKIKQMDEIKKRKEMEQQSEQKRKRSEKLISFGENEINHHMGDKNQKNNGNNLMKNTEPIIQNVKEDEDGEGWKKEGNEQSRDYKKTFSEAILDELFEKDERKQVQEKYNRENKYSQVIIGKIQKTVEIKQNTHSNIIKNINSNTVVNRQSTDTNHKKQSIHNQKIKNEELEIYEGQNSLQHKREYFGDSFEQNIQKFNTNQNINRYGQKTSPYNSKDPINPHLQIKENKQLRAESTVNMLINRNEQKGQNFRNSTAQTVQLSNHGQNNNQVSQTDNSQSHLVLEKLLRNYADDAEFRRRINQKRDQFNQIKIQFDQTLQIGLQQLINSKDSYIQYSQEFLSRLNHIIEDTTLIQRKKIQSYHSNRSSSSLSSRPSSISLNPQRFPEHLPSSNYLQVPLPADPQLRLPNQYKINVPLQNSNYVQQPVHNYPPSPFQNQHQLQTPSQIYFQAPIQVKQPNQSFPSPKPQLAYPPKLMYPNPVVLGQPINSNPHPNPSQIIKEVAYTRTGKMQVQQNKIMNQN